MYKNVGINACTKVGLVIFHITVYHELYTNFWELKSSSIKNVLYFGQIFSFLVSELAWCSHDAFQHFMCHHKG